MLNKVSAAARIVGLLLAIVAGFMPDIGFDIAMVLIVLGLIAGITMPTERIMAVGVFVLVTPAIAAALAHLPAIGAQLGAVFGALALFAAASLATAIVLMLYGRVREDATSITK
ncbi:MAG: hypothetical protein ACKOQM_05950 [Novosphingobium sp.]